MLLIDDIIDGKRIEIIIDDPWKKCWMRITNIKFDIVEESDYPNVIKLSANLVGIGYTNAVELLEKNNIPRKHPIWDLNHSDLWER